MKSIDRYGNGVSLTYNGKKSFPTVCGGILTILTILLVIYWWVATYLNHHLHPTRNFTQSTKSYLVNTADNADGEVKWSINYE